MFHSSDQKMHIRSHEKAVSTRKFPFTKITSASFPPLRQLYYLEQKEHLELSAGAAVQHVCGGWVDCAPIIMSAQKLFLSQSLSCICHVNQ